VFPNGGNISALGEFGYGIYKLTIKNLTTGRIDSCLIEHDYYTSQQTDGDCYINVRPDNTPLRFTYQFFRSTLPQNNEIEINYLSPQGYKLENWRPNGPDNSLNSRNKNFGPPDGFLLVESNLPDYPYDDYFPYDVRRDCEYINQSPPFYYYLSQNTLFPEEYNSDERQGIFTLNMTIKKDVHTPLNRHVNYNVTNLPASIIITPGVYIKIAEGSNTNTPRIFTMNPYQQPQHPYGTKL